MLSSLYAYKGTHAKTLSFVSGERFLEVGISKDINWLHVISEKGLIGYVPKNYVSLEQVSPMQMLELIDSCIESIHIAASDRGGNYSRDEHETLQRLVEFRQEWHAKVPPASHPSKRPAPPPPYRLSSHLSSDSRLVNGEISDDSKPPPPALPPSTSLNSLSHTVKEDSRIEVSTSFIERGNSLGVEEEVEKSIAPPVRIESLGKTRQSLENTVQNSTSVECIKNAIQLLPNGYYRKLVESVRSETNISYSTSHQVVTLLMKSFEDTFPFMKPLFKAITEEESKEIVGRSQSWNIKNRTLPLEDSSDGRKLIDILEKLRQCKDDEQQRSWALHEDEDTIKDLLQNLLDVLNDGDWEICNCVLSLDDFRPILTLVQYYQMETRWVLRKILLQVFGALCQMSKNHIMYLSSSVLPLELARQILDAVTSTEQLKYCSLVLGMVLCMADTLPFTHFSIFDGSFIEKILDGIEEYSLNPDTESLAELYLTLLLAFNLQYHVTSFEDGSLHNQRNTSENIVAKLLGKRKTCKYFLEKVLFLFNREDDPVAMFDGHSSNSVMCIMRDIFSSPQTANHLYINDEKVVCDIILRQITDLSSDDKRRRDYLFLLESLVTNGHWRDYEHRRKEFHSRLNVIASQEENKADALIANRILSLWSL